MQVYGKSTTAKSKYKNLATHAAYLSKITKREKSIKELKVEQKLIERVKDMMNKNKNQEKSIMNFYPFQFIPNLNWPGRKRVIIMT